MNHNFVVKQNLNLMEDSVIYLNEVNYEKTIQDNFGQPLIILFSERKDSSLLYRNLANVYKDKVVFC